VSFDLQKTLEAVGVSHLIDADGAMNEEAVSTLRASLVKEFPNLRQWIGSTSPEKAEKVTKKAKKAAGDTGPTIAHAVEQAVNSSVDISALVTILQDLTSATHDIKDILRGQRSFLALFFASYAHFALDDAHLSTNCST
jgi:hypothetical protein